jgi:hypothetical protein
MKFMRDSPSSSSSEIKAIFVTVILKKSFIAAISENLNINTPLFGIWVVVFLKINFRGFSKPNRLAYFLR